MIPSNQYDAHAAKCINVNITAEQRYELIKHMKLSYESIQGVQQAVYMRAFMPVISKVLMELTKPQEYRNAEHKTRVLALETLGRFVHNDALKIWLREVMAMAFRALRTDNEDCAIIAAHVILDLHKVYRPQLGAFVQPYIEIVMTFYQVYKESVKLNFPQQQQQAPQDPQGEKVKMALHSFKVLCECPLVVIFLFQIYPKSMPNNLPKLLPLMKMALDTKLPVGVAESGAVYGDYIHSQVKTVHFLSYYMKENLQEMKPFDATIPKTIVQLLLRTPPDALEVRKDLLLSMRLVLGTQFRTGFFPHIDQLLDMKNMIGTSKRETISLRPHALTILAELIDYVRSRLSLSQLSRIIHLYSVNAQDPNFSHAMHASSIRLMLRLIEPILKDRRQVVPARVLLVRLLYTLVMKFNSMAAQASRIVDATNEKLKAIPKPKSGDLDSLVSSVPMGDPYRQQLEARHLIRTLLVGLKTVVWSAMNIGGHGRSGIGAGGAGGAGRANSQPATSVGGPPGISNASAQLQRHLNESECEMLTTILPGILECVKLCPENNPTDVKEILDAFAQVFIVLDSRSFQDTFGFRMPLLFDIIMKNPSALAIPQSFLGNINISKYFADILLSFLVEKMKDVTGKDEKYAATLLQLSKILFYSVARFPDNEPVLRPHMGRIVRDCLHYASCQKDPSFYLQMLWNLFKALRAGKFELQFDLLYREFMPLVEPLIIGLMKLYDGPHRAEHHIKILELCLLVPARPSTMFPHLALQMKPILAAIDSGERGLVTLGLRTFEFWMDTLQPSYFRLLLDRVEPQLSKILHRHLRPSPYPFGDHAVRIIGKLGARSRVERLPKIEHSPDLNYNDSMILGFKWECGRDLSFPMDKVCRLAIDAILDQRPFGQKRADSTYKGHCFRLLKASLVSVLGIPPSLSDQSIDWGVYSSKHVAKTRARFRAEREHVTKIIFALVSCTLMEEIDGAREFAEGLAHWFGVIMAKEKKPTRERGMSLPGDIFATAVVRVLGRENRLHARGALVCLGHYVNSIIKYSSTAGKSDLPDVNETADEMNNLPAAVDNTVGKDDIETKAPQVIENEGPSEKLSTLVPPALSSLVEQLCHCCYQRLWYQKWAGAAGLAELIKRAPADVFRTRSTGSYQAHVVRALMFVVRDLPGVFGIETRDIARDALDSLFELCHKEKDPEQNRAVKDVAICLTAELTGRSFEARGVAQHAIRTLAKVVKCDVSELMTVAEDQLLRPLRRPLRQSQYPNQAGCIDAMAFVLRLKKPLLVRRLFASPLREHCLKPIIEICEDPSFMKLTEAEGQMKHKLIDNKLIKNEVVEELLALRRCAIDFLSVLVEKAITELREKTNETYFTKIVSCFFKNMQSRDQAIVESSMRGLKQAVSNYQMETALLQRNLRPILSTLADYKKLTLPYLKNLSRVLQILSNWFNLNLGDRLLELLGNWTNPQQLTAAKMWIPGTESRVGAAIIELFHLLPPRRGGAKNPRASKFLPKLIDMVLKLEALPVVAGPGTAHLGLKGTGAASTSPYREPLLKYCNKHPAETVKYLLSQLHRKDVFKLFCILLGADDGEPLRAAIVADTQLFLTSTLGTQDLDGWKAFQGVMIVDAVTERDAGWLLSHPEVITSLYGLWNSEKRTRMVENEQVIPVDQLSFWRRLANIFLRFCRKKNDECTILLSLLKAFMVRSLTDFAFIKDFIDTEVSKFSIENKRKIFAAFLDLFKDSGVSSDHKALVLKLLVIPIVEKTYEDREKETLAGSTGPRGATQDPSSAPAVGTSTAPVPLLLSASQPSVEIDPAISNHRDASVEQKKASLLSMSVLDAGLLRRLNAEVFEQPDDVLRTYNESLFAELLHLSTILIQYIPVEVGRFRRELIRFGWYHLKHDESIARQWAFVNISRFFHAYQAPPKIVLQVYCNLLRDSKQGHRRFFQRALDNLVPALPKRLPYDPAEHKYPLWVRYTKKAILEECSSVPQLMHILHVIVRHRNLFYGARGQFVPIMVSSLARGLNINMAAETRRITVDLAGLVLSWEKTRRERVVASSIRRSSDNKTSTPTVGQKRELTADQERSEEKPLQEPPAKMLKGESGQAVAIPRIPPEQTNVTTALPHFLPEVDKDEYRPNNDLVDKIFSFLTLLPFRLSEQREARLISDRCVLLLENALNLFPATRVNMDHVSKYFDQATGEKDILAATSTVSNAKLKVQKAMAAVNQSPGDVKAHQQVNIAKLEQNKAEKAERAVREKAAIRTISLVTSIEMGIILSSAQKYLLITQNSSFLESIIGPSVFSKSKNIAELFGKLLGKVVECERKRYAVDEKLTTAVIGEICKIVGYAMQRSVSSLDPVDTRSVLIIVDAMFAGSGAEELKLEMIHTYQDPLIKFYAHLAKEECLYRPSDEKESSERHKDKEAERVRRKEELYGQCLALLIRLLGSSMSVLTSTPRKVFLQNLMNFSERCRLPHVLIEIKNLVDLWLVNLPMYTLSYKEVANLLLKLVECEKLTGPDSDKMRTEYFNKILEIFGGDGAGRRRMDISARLEKCFMIGLRLEDAQMRAKFFTMYDGTIRREPVIRLTHILAKQEWDSLADVFWIKQAVQLFLSIVERKTPMVTIDSHAKFTSLVSKSEIEGDLFGTELSKEMKADESLSTFVNSLRNIDAGYLVKALDGLVFYDSSSADTAWVSLVPQIWGYLTKPMERHLLEVAFSSLLVKEHLSTQMNIRQNIVQPLVESAARCSPEIPLKPELLLHLGSRWNAWHLVLPYLGRKAERLTDEIAQSANSLDVQAKARRKANLDSVMNATAELYRQLNEKDYFVATWKSRPVLPNTLLGLTYEQHGEWTSAQNAYSASMIAYHGSAAHSVLNISEGSSGLLENAELALWQDRWIYCARELSQWDVLTEFSRTVVQTELMHDCLWRNANWGAFKELSLQHPIEDGPLSKIYQGYLCVQESKLDGAEPILRTCVHRALDQYNSLPVDGTLSCVFPTFVLFQRFVEVEESVKVLKDFHTISSRSAANNVPNLAASINQSSDQRVETIRTALNTWRERIPTRYELPSIWSSLLTWRNHVHQIIVNILTAYKDSQAGGSQKPNSSYPKQALVMGINETAWNVHRLARACRHQSLPDISIAALNKLYPFHTMELTEYFIKTKETAKAYLTGPQARKANLFQEYYLETKLTNFSNPLGGDEQYRNKLQTGLDALNATNLEHFTPRQKSQVYTIKGRFYDAMERRGDASKAYCTALGAGQDVGSTWFHYGIHCDKISRSDEHLPLLWREAAANCYIQAIRFGSRKARAYAARLLRLLTLDVEERPRKAAESGKELSGKGVMKMVMEHGDVLPPWIWLPWLGQIIPMLGRAEALAAREILIKVAHTYPQALYFGLRAFMEERVPIDRPSRNLSSDTSKIQRPTTPSLLPQAVAQQIETSKKLVSQAQMALLTQKAKFAAAHENIKVVQQAARDAGCTAQNAATPQFASLIAKQKQAQEEFAKEKKEYDKRAQALRQAEQQKANVQALIGSANSASAKNDAHLRQVASQARTPFEHADVVMAILVGTHQSLYFEMKRTAQEISTRMKPQQEEQFLGLMNGLLHRCFQSSVHVDQDIDPHLRNALEDVSKMCFGTKGSDGSAPSVVRIPESVRDLKEQFEDELAPQTAKDFPTKMEPFIKRLRKWKSLFQRRVDAMPETMRLELMSPNLIENRSKDVEVFGQYLMAEADEPTLDSHVKIVSFSADVRIIRRVLGASRGITILGDDGRNHEFLLETSVNAGYQRNEERVAQIFRLFNASMFAKHAETSRRCTKLEVPVLIPTGYNTRLVSFDPTISCLAEGLERYVESAGGNFDDPLMTFRQIAASAYARRRKERNTDQFSQEDSVAARLEAYEDVCKHHIPKTCLSSWIDCAVPSSNKRFGFIKRFADTLGSSSLVGYVLSVGARRPQNVYFTWATGETHTAHNRILLSPRGVLECDEKVPFRFTRNIRTLLGPYGKAGPFFGSIAATLKALKSSEDLLVIYLSLIIRDEIVPWVSSKLAKSSVSAPGGGGKRDEFDYLEERLRESIGSVMKRLEISADGDRSEDSIARTANFLIHEAENPANLGQMDARWQAWF